MIKRIVKGASEAATTGTLAPTYVFLHDMKALLCLTTLLGLISANAPAVGEESKFALGTDVLVRKESFACEKISELDRLIQLDGQGAFTSGIQLYQYLKRHDCVGLSTNRRVRVIAVQDHYVCVYDPKERALQPCGWTHRDGLSK